MGLKGLGLSASITNFILLTTCIIYCLCYGKISRALSRPNRESLRGWGEYLGVSLPATIILCSEWWTFEILTIVAGMISVEA